MEDETAGLFVGIILLTLIVLGGIKAYELTCGDDEPVTTTETYQPRRIN